MARPAPLDLWLYGARVATVVERRTDTFQLSYTDEAFDRWPSGRPLLSVALPLIPDAHPPGAVGPFLEGLLPEGEARSILEERYGVRRGDVHGLLSEIGKDCAGAVVVVPAGHPPPDTTAGAAEPITDEELARAIRQLPERPLGDDDRVRVSLAGQQSKLLLVRAADDSWARPVDGHPSTHILKPGDDRYPGMVANEAFCLRIAQQVGLTDIDVDVLDIDGQPVLAVSRYDRTREADGSVLRLHQEDFCQALAVDTGPRGSGKYEDAGGPALADLAGVLETHNGNPEQTARLAEITMFNVAVGNADAHGKNLSVLHPPVGPLRLAPLYDVIATVLYPSVHTGVGPRPVSSDAAMRVNSIRNIHQVTAHDVLAEADRWHRGPALDGRIRSLLERLPEAVQVAAEATPGVSGALVELVSARVAALFSDGMADAAQAPGCHLHPT